MREVFKDVEGFEGLYQVSNFGRVKSLKFGKERIMKQSKNTNKYLELNFRKEGKSYKNMVHRLVAQTFIPNPENKCEVNHFDGNKENNHVSNLEWNTRQENMYHAIENGLNKLSKLTEADVKEIYRLRFEEGMTRWELSKLFGVHINTIEQVRRGNSWKYLFDEYLNSEGHEKAKM